MNTQNDPLHLASPGRWALAALLLLAACGGPDPTLHTQDDELRRRDTPTRITFYSEAGLWGDSLTVTLTPTDDGETDQLVTTTDIEAANLARRISSIRMVCGTRASQIAAFRVENRSPALGAWDPDGAAAPFYCAPGETKEINLHTNANVAFADRIGSVYAVAHARAYSGYDLSLVVRNAWNGQTEDLGSNAEADGPVRLSLASTSRFRLRQDLLLDHTFCFQREAYLLLYVTIEEDRSMHVEVTATHVDSGFDDNWGCGSGMRSTLRSKAAAAADELETSLNLLTQAYQDDYTRLYFTPTFSTREFNLSGGAPPLVFDPGLGW
ncbi:MAG: hypothetical protein RIT81_45100 [Deltaproteobacteria bacterium]